jgi:cell division protein FtsB
MSSDSDPIAPIYRRRHLVVCCLFLLVVAAPLYLSVRGNRVQSAQAEWLAAHDAEIDAKSAETRSVLDEAKRLRQQADDLIQQAAKIAKGDKHGASGGGSTAPAKRGS